VRTRLLTDLTWQNLLTLEARDCLLISKAVARKTRINKVLKLKSQRFHLLIGGNLPEYLVLGNWTDEGFRNVKDAPDRIKETHRATEALGGKMTLYYTLGEYDFIMIFSMPDEKAIIKVLSFLGSKGYVRTKTLKAYTEEEGANLIKE
jgi:uncharacterized protein with GYD domain